MISITSKSRYAVVAMAELARSGERPVPIKELAERRGIPEQFLEQLFSTLRRAGLLTSHRGMKGGYTLSRPADEITVLEVVQTLDGKVGQEADEAGGSGPRASPPCARSSARPRSPKSPAARPRRPARGCTSSRMDTAEVYVCDLDGTLLRSDGTLSAFSRAGSTGSWRPV